jgi:hypothetical protein
LRGTTLSAAATAVINQSSTLNLGTKGRVIVTAAYNNANAVQITAQASQGGITASSRIGSVGGNANLPAGAIPPTNQTVYAMEIFYSYQPITPIGKLIRSTLPVQLYDVAYY